MFELALAGGHRRAHRRVAPCATDIRLLRCNAHPGAAHGCSTPHQEGSCGVGRDLITGVVAERRAEHRTATEATLSSANVRSGALASIGMHIARIDIRCCQALLRHSPYQAIWRFTMQIRTRHVSLALSCAISDCSTMCFKLISRTKSGSLGKAISATWKSDGKIHRLTS